MSLEIYTRIYVGPAGSLTHVLFVGGEQYSRYWEYTQIIRHDYPVDFIVEKLKFIAFIQLQMKHVVDVILSQHYFPNLSDELCAFLTRKETDLLASLPKR